MSAIARACGVFLVAISVLSIAQTLREVVLFESGESKYPEGPALRLPIHFGGHVVAVADDQPHMPGDTNTYYKATQGRIQVFIDSHPHGEPSTARIRVTLDGLGRYFGWVDALQFKKSNDSDASVWFSRRIQKTASAPPIYEITTIDGNGAIATDTFPAWRLGTDYHRFRATQFMQTGTHVMPLSMADVLGVMPIFVLVFPLGTLLLGVLLLRRQPAPRKAVGA